MNRVEDNAAAMMQILDIQTLNEDLYKGISLHKDRKHPVYGGQILAQALQAAFQTVPEDRLAHNLHAYFLRAGDPDIPIQYRILRVRDGRSFTARQVDALQRGKVISSLDISFQTSEVGLSHQTAMPDNLPDPNTLANGNDTAFLRQQAQEAGADPNLIISEDGNERDLIDIRHLVPVNYFRKEVREPELNAWMRIKATLPDSLRMQQVALTYLSDWSLLDSSLGPYGSNWGDDHIQALSLDHSLWFHAHGRADEWLLFTQESVKISKGRGFNRGLVFSPNGALIASLAQEALVRDRRRQAP